MLISRVLIQKGTFSLPLRARHCWLIVPAAERGGAGRPARGLRNAIGLVPRCAAAQAGRQGGSAQASWLLSRVYHYCAGDALDPAGYQADDLLIGHSDSPGVRAMLAARQRVGRCCAGFPGSDGLDA